MITLYERNKLPVDESLTAQYLQSPRIARDFAVYYDLFLKYRADYQVDKILSGKAPEEVKNRAAEAQIDERLALTGFILDALLQEMREQSGKELTRQKLFDELKNIRSRLCSPEQDLGELFDNIIRETEDQLARGIKASSVSQEDADAMRDVIRILEEMRLQIQSGKLDNGTTAFTQLMAVLAGLRKKDQKYAKALGKRLSNAYAFCEDAFGDGQELLILTTELTVNSASVRFIGKYGCDAYFRHNKDLMLYERQLELLGSLDELNLDELQ